MSHIYINLPIKDLEKSIAFYQALGFTQNMQFSDEKAAAMQYDDNLTIMLLTHEFTKGFLPTTKEIADSHKTCGGLYALQFDSKEQVDTFFEKALMAGGKATIPTYDYGFMYGRDFEDLDGYIREAFWMNAESIPQE
ncbi:MAG TPA: VOC family protein [Candidatus Absconditabacterales bacterium]|nr:VOC family protein [Candidatus Absconditabacterales bacterium]HNG97297.1 VOC family protein [Candidatus Absconditabacterales bacterium]